MPKITALFSGQGSQYPGMGKELYDNFDEVRQVYRCAGDILGFDVAKLSFEGEESDLARTAVAQPLIFTHSVACFTAAKQAMDAPNAVAGHSLGEYAALYCAGGYSLEDGMRIIGARARVMEEAAKAAAGAMFAIVGPDAAAVEQVCGETDGFVLPVNFNLPTQTVISGEEAAAVKAADALAAQGAKAVRLSVGSAFHTEMMAGAAQALREQIGGIAYRTATVDFYSNLTGGRLVVEDYPEYFARHMVSPVRFVEEVAAMVEDGVEICVEFGPKKTAATLAKKNARSLSVYNVEDIKTLNKLAEALG